MVVVEGEKYGKFQSIGIKLFVVLFHQIKAKKKWEQWFSVFRFLQTAEFGFLVMRLGFPVVVADGIAAPRFTSPTNSAAREWWRRCSDFVWQQHLGIQFVGSCEDDDSGGYGSWMAILVESIWLRI